MCTTRDTLFAINRDLALRLLRALLELASDDHHLPDNVICAHELQHSMQAHVCISDRYLHSHAD